MNSARFAREFSYFVHFFLSVTKTHSSKKLRPKKRIENSELRNTQTH